MDFGALLYYFKHAISCNYLSNRITDLEIARRKRLQALASKFKVYDDDDDDLSTKKRSNTLTLATAAASSSPSRRERTKIVDVDKEINRMSTTGNGKTKNLAGDANFMSSLKAQGFEETQSKTKLVRKNAKIKINIRIKSRLERKTQTLIGLLK